MPCTDGRYPEEPTVSKAHHDEMESVFEEMLGDTRIKTEVRYYYLERAYKEGLMDKNPEMLKLYVAALEGEMD